jgi:hypothetical protein
MVVRVVARRHELDADPSSANSIAVPWPRDRLIQARSSFETRLDTNALPFKYDRNGKCAAFVIPTRVAVTIGPALLKNLSTFGLAAMNNGD